MPHWLDSLAQFITARRGLVLSVVVACVAFAGVGITRLQADFTPSDLFADFEGQEELATEFKGTFGNTDNIVLVVVEADNIYEPQTLGYLHSLSLALRDAGMASRVESVTLMPAPRRAQGAEPGEAGELTVTDSIHELYEALIGPLSEPAAAAERLRERRDGDSGTAAIVVDPIITSTEVSAEEAAQLEEMLNNAPLVRGRLIAEDAGAAAIAVFLPEHVTQNSDIEDAVVAIEEVVARISAPDGVTANLGGLPYVRKVVVSAMKSDQSVLLPMSLLVCLIVLLASFRWFPALVLPSIVVIASVVLLVGGMGWAGESFNIINNIVPTLVIVIGISDSIHLISRYREEIGAGLDRAKASTVALKTMAIACFLTSFTTAVGFASLAVSRTEILARFGITAAIGVLLAYLATVLLLPTLLTFVAPPKGVVAGNAHETLDDAIEWATRLTLRLRWLILGAATVFAFTAIYIGMTKIHVDSRVLDQVNPNSEVFRTTKLIEAKLGGMRPLDVYFRAEAGRLDDVDILNGVEELQRVISEEEGVLSTLAWTDYLVEARAVMTGLTSTRAEPFEDSAQAAAIIELLYSREPSPMRPFLLPDASRGRATFMVEDMGARATMQLIAKVEVEAERIFGDAEGVEVLLTGDAYVGSRGLDVVIRDLLVSLALAFVIIFGFLTVLLRSPRLGLLSIPPNVLPLLGTLAWMALRGVPLNTATVIIFSISIGLAVDGTIHVLARFREEMTEHGDVDRALVRAARGTGKAILLTCVALILGFSVMLTSQFVPIRRFGELIAVTVFGMLISTIFVLPALLRVGYRNQSGVTAAQSAQTGE